MTFTGAGLLLVEQNYKSKITSRYEPAIILFGDKNRRYQDLGGLIDKKDKINGNTKLNINKILAKTASREAKEESYGLVDLDYRKVLMLPYVDIGQYRCFILVIQPSLFYSTKFYYNKQLNINGNHEIYTVSRFYITDLLHTGLRYGNDIICIDANNTQQIIRNRTVKILNKVLQAMIFDIIDIPNNISMIFDGRKYIII